MIERDTFEVQFVEYTLTGVILHVKAELAGGGRLWDRIPYQAPTLVPPQPKSDLAPMVDPYTAGQESSVQRIIRESRESEAESE